MNWKWFLLAFVLHSPLFAQTHVVTVGDAGRGALSAHILAQKKPKETDVMVFTRTRGGDMGHFASFDSGASWSGGTPSTLPPGGHYVFASYVNAGLFYCASIIGSIDSSNVRIVVSESQDDGQTWTPRDTVASDIGSLSQDPPHTIAVDTSSAHRGRIVLAWVGYAGLTSSFSDDSGKAFATPVVAAHDNSQLLRFSYPLLLVTGTGGVCAFYVSKMTGGMSDWLDVVVSSDGAASWAQNVIPFQAVNSNGVSRPYAVGCSPLHLITVAIQVTNGVVDFTTDDEFQNSNSHILIGAKTFFPMMATGFDEAGTLYVAWLNQTTMGGILSGLYLAYSLDTGATWRYDTLSAFSISALQTQDTIGFQISVCPFANHQIALAFSGASDSLHVAVVRWGTALQNDFEGATGFVQTLLLASDSTIFKTTAHPANVFSLVPDTEYIARPDSLFHRRTAFGGRSFKFRHWNESAPLYRFDSSFSHHFAGPGLSYDLEEANYKRIDSVRLFKNFEGTTTDSLWWGGGAFVTPSNRVPSGFVLDTALHFDPAFQWVYSFRCEPAKGSSQSPFLNTYWWFEAWSKNGAIEGIDDTILRNQHIDSSPTVVTALMKGHLRSADDSDALSSNGGRKACVSNRSNDGKHSIVYESRGNVYFASSETAEFCEFVREKRLNFRYGAAHHPAIASYSNYSEELYVVWDEELQLSADTAMHYVLFRARHANGMWQGEDTSVSHEPSVIVVDSFIVAKNWIDKATPSVCSVRTADGITRDNVLHGAIVWHRDSTVWITAIVPFAGRPVVSPIHYCLDTGHCGLYVTVEAGLRGIIRMADSLHDADFVVSWQDSTMANNGKSGGLKWRCLLYRASGWTTLTPTNVVMSNFILPRDSDNTPWGIPQHPSICVQPRGASQQSALVSYVLDEKSSMCAMPRLPRFWQVKRRSGMYVRIKDSINGSWGLFRIVVKYSDRPMVFAPSIAVYKNLPSRYRLAWWRSDPSLPGTLSETVQFGEWAFTDTTIGASGRDYYPDLDSVRVTNGENAKTPHIQYGEKADSSCHGILCSKRSTSMPRTIRRANVNCESPDNRTVVRLHGYDELTAYTGAAFARVSVGEFKIIDSSGSEQSVPLMQEMMLKPAATPDQILRINGTCYFTLPSNAKHLTYFHVASMADSTNVTEFDAGKSVVFTTMILDSATDIPIMPLSQSFFQDGAVIATCKFDTVLIGMLAALHKTLYIATYVDTGMGGLSDLSLQYSRVYSEDKLSDVLSENSGLGKEDLHSAGRLGMVPEGANPLELTVYPNPGRNVTTAAWRIPVEDADDVSDLIIFNMMAQTVLHPMHEDYAISGKHEVVIDASALPTGRYIVAVHTKSHQQSKMLILTR
jgi:hypothetical protein